MPPRGEEAIVPGFGQGSRSFRRGLERRDRELRGSLMNVDAANVNTVTVRAVSSAR